jgi:hypothetical protein
MHAASSQEPLLAQTATVETATANMKKQLELAAKVFGIDVQTAFKLDTTATLPPYGLEVRKIKTADGKHLSFDMATGQLTAYFDSKPEEVPADLTKDNAIPQEKAMEAGVKLLNDLGVDAAFESKKTQYEDAAEVKPSDLMGAEWVVHGPLKYKGIPYYGSGVRVSVSAYSGKVMQYSYRPMGNPPKNLEEKINSQEAAKMAMNSVGKQSEGKTWAVQGTPIKVIAFPGEIRSPMESKKPSLSERPRLCWLVNLSPGDDDFPMMVLVDAVTGKVCGGVR